MITVEQAEKLILENAGDFGAEIIPLEQAVSRVLAENIKVDGEVILMPGQLITPAVINVAASVGETELRVKRLPRVIILSFYDELAEVRDMSSPYLVQTANGYMIKAILAQSGIDVAMLHLSYVPETTHQKILQCLQHYDVVLLTGDTSISKFDNVLKVLNKSGVEQLLYKIRQYPGELFWFGKNENGVVVFAFPVDPSATLMCMHRYFIPWLNTSLTILSKQPAYAILDQDFTYKPQLKHFLQVKLKFDQQGQLLAAQVEGNSSGNVVSLTNTDAFMELPSDTNDFKKGEVYKVWLLS